MKIPQKNVKNSGIEWIGDIPNDWSIIRTKFCCQEIYSGGTPSTSIDRYWGGSIPWIPSGMCHDCLIETYDTTITEEGLNNSSTKLIPSNTVLIAMTGATCGQTGFLCFESCANQSVMCFVENKKVLNSKYLWFVLQSAKDDILAKRNGGAQSGINGDICRNIIIPFAKIEIQNRIVYELERKLKSINELVKTEEEQIEKLKEYKQSIITEVVTKGLDKNIEMKDSGVEWIGKIPKHTKISKVKYFYDVTLGKMVQPNKIREDDTYEKYLCAVNVGDNVLKYDTVKEMWISNKDKMNYKVAKGDLIVVEGGDVGSCAIYDADFKNLYFQNALHRVRSNKYSVEFLRYWLIFAKSKKYFDVICNKATIAHFTKEKFDNLLLIVYDVEEQNNIVKYLDNICLKIDKLTEIKYKKIEKLNEYKKSLIYEYVTGKKEV